MRFIVSFLLHVGASHIEGKTASQSRIGFLASSFFFRI